MAQCAPYNRQQQQQQQQQQRAKLEATSATRTILDNLHNLSPFIRDHYYEDDDHESQQSMGHRVGMTCRMKFRLFMSEFLGTFILVYLSQSALSSFELLGTQNDIITRRLATILTYGLAYLLASSATLELSGSHLNPAYTLASAFYGCIRWSYACNYIAAQYLGSLLAAIFLHATFSDKLAQRHSEGLLSGMNATLRAHGNILSTGKFFSSYPPTEVSLTQLNISYTLATAMLVTLIQLIYKSKLIKVPKSIKPIYLAAAHCLIIAAFSGNGGPVFNPAQDFSPRFYIYLSGWGSSAFNLYNFKYWWLSCIVAPHIGAVIGFAVYKLFEHIRTISDDNKIECAEPISEHYQHRPQAYHRPVHNLIQPPTLNNNTNSNNNSY